MTPDFELQTLSPGDPMSDLEGPSLDSFNVDGFDSLDGLDGYNDPLSDGLFESQAGDGYEGFDSMGVGDQMDWEATAPAAVSDAETASDMMELYADIAAESGSDSEADQFLPLIASLAPMAVKALAPLAVRAARQIAPQVARGVLRAGRQIISSGAGRQALRALPQIARSVATDTLRRAANGLPVTQQSIIQSAARRTLPYIEDRRRRHQAIICCRRRAQMIRRRMLAQQQQQRQLRFG